MAADDQILTDDPVPQLKEEHRTKLDAIVKKMIANGESDDDINFVVSDFKKKYSAQEPPKKKIDLGGGLPSPTKRQEVAPNTLGVPESFTNYVDPKVKEAEEYLGGHLEGADKDAEDYAQKVASKKLADIIKYNQNPESPTFGQKPSMDDYKNLVTQNKVDILNNPDKLLTIKARNLEATNPEQSKRIYSNLYRLRTQSLATDESAKAKIDETAKKIESGTYKVLYNGQPVREMGIGESIAQAWNEKNDAFKRFEDLQTDEGKAKVIAEYEQELNNADRLEVPGVPGGMVAKITSGFAGMPIKVLVAGAGLSLLGQPELAQTAGTAVGAVDFGILGAMAKHKEAYMKARLSGKTEQEATDIAFNQSVIGGVAGAITGAAFNNLPRGIPLQKIIPKSGLLNVSKQLTENLGKEFLNGIAPSSVAALSKFGENIASGAEDPSEGVLESGADMMAMHIANQVGIHSAKLLGKLGAPLINKTKIALAKIPKEELQKVQAEDIAMGSYTKEDADAANAKIDKLRPAVQGLPENTAPEAIIKAADKIERRSELEAKLETADKALHPEIKEKIKAINEDIVELSKQKAPKEKSERLSPKELDAIKDLENGKRLFVADEQNEQAIELKSATDVSEAYKNGFTEIESINAEDAGNVENATTWEDVKANSKKAPKEEEPVETDNANTSNVSEGVGGENPALKDVENTIEALEELGTKTNESWWDEFGTIKGKTIIIDLADKFIDKNPATNGFKDTIGEKAFNEFEKNGQLSKLNERFINLNKEKLIAEAYHKAKADGSNPELVKAVEQSLKETEKTNTSNALSGGDIKSNKLDLTQYPRILDPTKPISEMSSEEMRTFANKQKLALREFDKKFEGKTEQEKEEGGYYSISDDVSDLNETAQIINWVETSENVNDLADTLKSVLNSTKDNPNEYQLAILNAAKNKASELGVTTNELIKKIAQKVKNQYSDIDDAELMVGAMLQKLLPQKKSSPTTSKAAEQPKVTTKEQIANEQSKETTKVPNQTKAESADIGKAGEVVEPTEKTKKQIDTHEDFEKELSKVFDGTYDKVVETGANKPAKEATAEDYLSKGKAVLNEMFPNVEVKAYETSAEYEAKEGRPKGSAGMFDPAANRIALNLEAIKSKGVENTIFHEVIHPIVNEVIGKNEEALTKLYDGLEGIKNEKGMEAVWEHMNQYFNRGGKIQKVEAVTEFLSLAADGKIDTSKLSKSTITKIIEWVNQAFEALGISKRISTADDLKSLSDSVIKALQEGDTSALKETLGKRKESKAAEKSIADLEVKRDAEISKIMKPEVKMELVSVDDLVNSKEPIAAKERHAEIKDKYKELRKLVDCLWAMA